MLISCADLGLSRHSQMAVWLGRVKPLPEPQRSERRWFFTKAQEGQMETYDAHKQTTDVRQGSRRLDNFWVLIVSIAVVIAAFAIIYLFFYVTTPPSVITP
jgi:hypothetical protein